MTPQELLQYLQQRGIELWIEDDKLKYRGLKQTLPPALVAMLKQHKSELRQLLRTRTPRKAEQYPLSYVQKAFWFLHQMNPMSSAYVASAALTLRGAINLSAMHKAFTLVCLRHQALRTRFVLNEDGPWQQIESSPTSALTVIDATLWTDATLIERLNSLAHKPFDLLSDPAIRCHLYQRGKEEHVLYLSMHHILVDGWSMAILLRELGAFYLGALSGNTARLPPLLAGYHDFTRWQQQLVLSEAGNAHLQYWLQNLSGDLSALDLPTDRPRPATRQEHGQSISWYIEPDLSSDLKTRATAAGTTPYVLLLSAFAVLLGRCSNQQEMLIGSPVHGRSEAQFNNVVGCFINSIALRVRLSPSQTFGELIQDIHERTRAALAHADYPFPLLVKHLRPERDSRRTPLFQVMFAYENFQGAEVIAAVPAAGVQASAQNSLFGVPMEVLPVDQMEGQFDLSLTILEAGGAFHCVLSFDTDLFDRSTAQRMTGHYTQLLRGAVQSLDQPVSLLPLLTQEERQQLLIDWNRTSTPYPNTECIHERFAAQAEATPDAVAVVYLDQRLTYRELSLRVQMLAQKLRTYGVRKEVCVGIFLERSLDLVVGILGVLVAGGAYVPLDTALPEKRLLYMLSDAAVGIVVTHSALKDRLPITPAAKLFVDEGADSALPSTASLLDSRPTANNLAYVIYTSGSTGKPRGVMVTHRTVMNYWAALAATVCTPLSDRPLRISLNSSTAFDASLDALLQLLSGHVVHIISEQAHRDPDALVAYIKQEALDIFECVPTQAAMLIEAGLFKEPNRSPARLVLGGEAISPSLWQELGSAGSTVVYNLYGPTECTVANTACRVFSNTLIPHIGRPLHNIRIYILDPQMNPIPIGVRGELYIGGVGPARGYLNQAGLTGERFLPDPFSPQPGARMYKSGDLARYLPDGNIEFLGRIDQQVKIRGYRIEIEEIESVLRTHQMVQDCAVVVHEEQPGEKQLLAYLVLRTSAPIEENSLRDFLKQRLPDYMLPAAFVTISQVPLTISGKLDRRALPLPTKSHAPESVSTLPPRDELELVLTQIWEALLNTRPIGVTDNFFDLGGNSLIAVRLIAQIKRRIGRRLPMSVLSQNATIARLAPLLRQQDSRDSVSPIVPLHEGGEGSPLFCIHPAGGQILCYLELARQIGFEQPIYAIWDNSLETHTPRPKTVEAMAARYIQALQAVQQKGPYRLCGWSFGGTLAFEMAQQLLQAGDAVTMVVLLDSFAPGAVEEAVDEHSRLRFFLVDLYARYGLLEVPELRSEDASATALGRALQRLQQASLVPDDLLPIHLESLFTLYEHHLRLAQDYKPRPLSYAVTLLRAKENQLPASINETLGWQSYSTLPVEVEWISGTHFTMLAKPQVKDVAAVLKKCLLRPI